MEPSPCLWTAWGDVVCSKAASTVQQTEGFALADARPIPPPISCSNDLACDALSRCDMADDNGTTWKCRACSDIGCVSGKSCLRTSDCAPGLACETSSVQGSTHGICTVANNVAGPSRTRTWP